MRLARIVSLVTGMVLGTAGVLQAQHSGGLMEDVACSCSACTGGGYSQECCPPLLPNLVRGIHSALGCLFCCPGLNARHDIYRAALHRNDFGKCSKFVPIYSCRKCGCGGVNPLCPHCGPGGEAEGEEVLEMQDAQEVPDSLPPESTPTLDPQTPPAPADSVPPQAARARSSHSQERAVMHRPTRPATAPKAARTGTMRDRVARTQVGDEAPRPVQRTAGTRSQQAPSPIQRAMLFQSRESGPDNSLRK